MNQNYIRYIIDFGQYGIISAKNDEKLSSDEIDKFFKVVDVYLDTKGRNYNGIYYEEKGERKIFRKWIIDTLVEHGFSYIKWIRKLPKSTPSGSSIRISLQNFKPKLNIYDSETVYIEESKKLYHKQNCSYPSSMIPIKLKKANDELYKPCKCCRDVGTIPWFEVVLGLMIITAVILGAFI